MQSTTASLDVAQVQRYVKLTLRKRELQADLAEVQEQLDELEPVISEMFIDAGVQHLRIDDHTVFLASELWASPLDGDHESLCAALSKAGHGDMVQTRVNHQTLSAWVRELRKEGEPIPADVEPYIKITEATRARVRKA